MSLFGATAQGEILQALRERRTVFIIGQRRCGLTHWTQKAVVDRLSGFDPIFIEIPKLTDARSLREVLCTELAIGKSLVVPSDLSLAVQFSSPRLAVLHNAHRLSPDALDWLLRALLDQPSRNGTLHFVIEGAVDFDLELERVFPDGLTESPFVIWSESMTPWATVAHVERFLHSRRPECAPWLIPLLVDYTRGDLGIIADLLERLPRRGDPSSAEIEKAWRTVENRASVVEIRTAVRQFVVDESAALTALASGGVVRDAPPPNASSRMLRTLHLAGALAYDVLAGGFCVRGPVAARAVAGLLSTEALSASVEASSVQARVSFFVWQIASVELRLRSLISRSDWVSMAASVKVDVPWAGRAKRIRDAAAKAGLPAEVLGTLNGILREELPENESIDTALNRRGSSGQRDSVLAPQFLTFSELVAVAVHLHLVGDSAQRALGKINKLRNEIAHFRPVTADDGAALTACIRDFFRTLP